MQTSRMSQEAAEKPGQRELYRSERLGIWTKIRPGAWHFLAKASKLFELWAYSSSSRPYADAMADLLDPDAMYFADRVIAAGSDGPGGAIDPLNARLRSGERTCIVSVPMHLTYGGPGCILPSYISYTCPHT